jgi:uncharacterized membrane protein YedE/YeeE
MSTEAALRANRAFATSGIDWVPCLAGIGIGVLSWLVFVVVATPIGVTTAASHISGGVAGLGVLLLVHLGLVNWHGRDANMLGVLLGGGLFGIGMVLYGYCPGTAIAAMATGSLHALVGIVGMLAGAMLYAYSFAWVRDNVLSPWGLGKITLSDLTGLPALLIYALLAALALVFFRFLESRRIAS